VKTDLVAKSDSVVLVKLEEGRRALAEAKSIPEVKEIRDKARAIRDYLKQARYCLEMQNDAAELKLRAERRMGEMLAETPLHNGDPRLHDATRLSDLGIEKTQSHRYQLAATVPEPVFEDFIAKTKEAGQELTSRGVIRVAHLLKRQSVPLAPLPTGKYACIVCDPPWEMDIITQEIRPWQVNLAYPTMGKEQLFAFPLPDLAADDCHLYLWFTHRHLLLALRLCEHWGFRYECLLTWDKSGGFTPFHSFQRTTEHALFCRRGSLKLLRDGLSLCIREKRREHSRKPEAFYELVKQASPGPRVDLFSRENRDGFTCWGNEAGKFNGDTR
jgi:N6-adenosine-specific RNA methylase IME4